MDILSQFNKRVKEVQLENEQATTFAKKQIRLEDSRLFFIPGFEKVLLAIYSVFLPYLAGLLFLFIYVAKGSFVVFNALSTESSFIFSWCIGYECLATLALLIIIYNAIKFNLAHYKSGKKATFVRPT